MSATNSHSLQINIYWKLNVNNTSTWTPTTVCSAQPTCSGLRPQRAEPCLHLSRGGWRCAHIPSSHHKKTWSPSSSFKLESDAWWRKTQQSSWATTALHSFSLSLPHSWLVLCFKQAHKEKNAHSRVASSAKWKWQQLQHISTLLWGTNQIPVKSINVWSRKAFFLQKWPGLAKDRTLKNKNNQCCLESSQMAHWQPLLSTCHSGHRGNNKGSGQVPVRCYNWLMVKALREPDLSTLLADGKTLGGMICLNSSAMV